MLRRVQRRLILPLLAICLLVIPASADATVTREGLGGSISLASDAANDTIGLACVAGEAQSGGEDLLPCASVESIFVKGGGGEDTVNLANVDTAEFPALRFVEISVDEDFEPDIVSASKIGDEVIADFEDTVVGGPGNDIIDGGEVSGGEGDDVMLHTTGSGSGGSGDDRFQNSAGIGPFAGGPGSDTYAIDLPSGATINVSFEVEDGGLGVITTAESGFFFWSSIDRVDLSLADGGTQTVDASHFSGALEANGRGGHDVLVGGPGEDFLSGGRGNDELTGNGGFDWVDGGEDADRLQLRDGETDRGICGPGADLAIADVADILAGCEQVELPSVPPPIVIVDGKPLPDSPPQTEGLKGPKKVVQGKAASFRFRSSEQGGTFKCKVDKGPLKACTSPYKASTGKLAPNKQHTFSVFAIDAAGNKDQTPATLKFKVEEKPPAKG